MPVKITSRLDVLKAQLKAGKLHVPAAAETPLPPTLADKGLNLIRRDDRAKLGIITPADCAATLVGEKPLDGLTVGIATALLAEAAAYVAEHATDETGKPAPLPAPIVKRGRRYVWASMPVYSLLRDQIREQYFSNLSPARISGMKDHAAISASINALASAIRAKGVKARLVALLEETVEDVSRLDLSSIAHAIIGVGPVQGVPPKVRHTKGADGKIVTTVLTEGDETWKAWNTLRVQSIGLVKGLNNALGGKGATVKGVVALMDKYGLGD
jgi:hypothetical protein